MAFNTVQEKLDRKVAGLHLLGGNIGKTLESAAKSNASWTDRTSNTRRAIHGGADKAGKGTVVFLEHGSKVGWYMEEGTGIYGPKGRPIVPTSAQALMFSIGGSTIFAKSIEGMPAQPIIEPTVKSGFPKIKEQIREYWSNT